ncbi:hypothetical protein [Kitasatospora sp. NPDC058046]|uniref:hypothetical protein n=1 Tax=Kitasatospora sp. NPDC058046 TaxID=3346312 RepID=UPI0036DCFF41
MTLDGISRTDTDPARLASGSPIAKALTDLGGNGLRALGHLRDARIMLSEAGRWEQPYEAVMASCRAAIDSLLKEAGREFEGVFDAQEAAYRELQAFLGSADRKPVRPAGPLDALLAAVVAAEEMPPVLDPRTGLGAAVGKLLAVPAKYRPDPTAEFEAVTALLALMAPMTALPPAGAEEQKPLLAALAAVRETRGRSTARRAERAQADGGDDLAALREAFAYWAREREDKGGYRRRQIEHLVEKLTREAPGPGEAEAVRLWGRFYADASGVLHGGQVDGAGDDGGADAARGLLEEILLHVEQLVLGLPALAPELLRLVKLQAPSAADVEAVRRWHQPRQVRYFFEHAESPLWLDALSVERLLPEPGRWAAEPYLHRVAGADPQKALSWLTANLPAFTGAGAGALAALVRVARTVGASSAGLVRAVSGQEAHLDDLLRHLVGWLHGIPAPARDQAWVDVMKNVLLHMVVRPGGHLWEIQQGLLQLQAVVFPPEGEQNPVLRVPVRAVLAKAFRAALAAEDRDLPWGELDLVGDLRALVVADDFGPSATLLAARAVLDYARTESLHGTALGERTAQWEKTAAGRAADRLTAVHLLEVPPAPEGEKAWWERALGVAAGLGAVVRVSDDVADFVATVVEHCPHDVRDRLEAVLADAFGSPPEPADLAAALEATAAGQFGRLAPVWSVVRALSPVLPVAVLEPWQPVVDALNGIAGVPDRRPGPVFRVDGGFLDRLATAAREVGALATAQGVGVAARTLAARREEDLSDGYARNVLGRVVAADPVLWESCIPDAVEGLGDAGLACAYLAALQAQCQAEPCPFADRGTAIAQAARAAWNLLPEVTRSCPDDLAGLELTLCLLLRDAWADGHGLDGLEDAVVPWLISAVTVWTAPTRTPQHQPPAAYAHLDALIHWGLARTGADSELPEELATLLTALLDTGDDHALAAIGTHLPDLLERAPQWTGDHHTLLFGLDHPSRPVLTWLTHQSTNPDTVLAIVRLLDRTQLAAYLRGDDPADQVVRICAALLLARPEELGGHDSFLGLVADGDHAPRALSRLLHAVAWALPRTTGAATGPLFERGIAIWRSALALDPCDPAAVEGAGQFAFTEAMDDTVWLELTAATVDRTALVSGADAVARRAARHPQSHTARAIVTRLLPLCDDAATNDLPPYRRKAIAAAGITLWNACDPEGAGRAELGEALIQHVGFLEAAERE